MPKLIGPDFISIQAADLDAARAFYSEMLGLPIIDGPPDAVVFDSKPVPFAVRKPMSDLSAVEQLGQGVALWFASDDADALHEMLSARGMNILSAPKDSPFGRVFVFVDPFGYTITAHTVR